MWFPLLISIIYSPSWCWVFLASGKEYVGWKPLKPIALFRVLPVCCFLFYTLHWAEPCWYICILFWVPTATQLVHSPSWYSHLPRAKATFWFPFCWGNFTAVQPLCSVVHASCHLQVCSAHLAWILWDAHLVITCCSWLPAPQWPNGPCCSLTV